jgi:general secretion pathway protein B
MSLILDALKKSELERRRDKAPDLQTIHQPIIQRAPRRTYGLLLGSLLIAANAAALIYWWQQRGVPSAVTSPLPATVAAPAPALAPVIRDPAPPVVPQPAAAAPLEAPLSTATATAEYSNISPAGPTQSAALPANDARIEEVDELPEEVRNNLPAMTFSFHVYSTNPQQRTIIINNRRMREGEEVNAGLVLQQITEDGVILQYLQHRIHISVLSGW